MSTIGVTNPAPQAIYQSERYGNFTYTLTGLTPSAPYTLRLHFAEIYWNKKGARLFNVTANTQRLLTNFDVFDAAGGKNKAIVETSPVTTDGSGTVTIAFSTVKDNANSAVARITEIGARNSCEASAVNCDILCTDSFSRPSIRFSVSDKRCNSSADSGTLSCPARL